MIGKLKRIAVREKYNKKVARIEIDVSYEDIAGRQMDEEELERWLNHRVGHFIGFDITALDEQEQDVLDKSDQL